MGIIAKEFRALTELAPSNTGAARMPGVDFAKFWQWVIENEIHHGEFKFIEIVDWDIAPMRGYLHAATIAGFVKKFNETCKHPANGHFHKSEVKDFLKAKFLGWNQDSDSWAKWNSVLNLDKPIKDIFAYLALAELVKTIKPPLELISTEDLTPEEYWLFIEDSEKYYYELFQEMYDIQEKPEKPE